MLTKPSLAPTSMLPESVRREVRHLKVVPIRPGERDELVTTLSGWWVSLSPESYAPFDLPECTAQETQALRLHRSTTPQARSKAFITEGLGPYNTQNEILRSLGAKGYIRVGKVRIEILPRGQLWLLNFG